MALRLRGERYGKSILHFLLFRFKCSTVGALPEILLALQFTLNYSEVKMVQSKLQSNEAGSEAGNILTKDAL